MAGRKALSADDDATGFQNEGDDGLYEDLAEDDDEDEDGLDAYERDGFIVDDLDEEEEEEEEEDNCGERQKKKKKKKREAERSYLLDEDDYELLQESNISVPRPNLNKKLKRLKKAQGDTKEESSQFSGERQHNGSEKGWRTAEERLKYRLFGDDDGQSLEDMDEEDEQQEKQDVDIAEEDEMADFIVDEDQVDEHGAPIRRKKQPRSMQQSGIPSSALQEAHEIFGDVEDLLKIRKLEAVDTFGEAGERSLEDQFDPSVLSEKYMTGRDEQIRKIDIPERIQIYEESTDLSPLDEISIEVESEWIYNQLVSGLVPFYSKSADATEGSDELKDHIAKYLELLHVQKLDVPFIAMYRKEEIMCLLKDPDDPEAYLQADPIEKPKLKRHKVLWTIRDLDQKWLLLLKRKGTLQSYYAKRFKEETRRVYDETKLNLNQQLFESITISLKAANSESEVDDVDSKFSLHFPPDEVVLDEGTYKRPKRKSHYSICSKAGLWEVANRFGYSSEQFGLQISLEKMRMDELEDAKEAPEEMASNFICMMFETPQAVLKGARHMAAVEISCEPSVRKHVRSIFMDNAVVSTSPTPDGNAAIDSFHMFSGVKWLRDKPLSRFEDAQWLLIQKAEEEKLLQVTIKLPEAVLDKLLSDSFDYYLSDGVSKSSQLWNEQRKKILQDAFHNILLPSMEKAARSWLTSRSKTWLLEEYGKLLWEKVSVAPYQRKENDNSSNEEAAPRVLACCWGPGKPATTFVMLDSSGEIEDVLNAGCLNLRGQSVNDLQRKKNDQQRVQKFMMDHQPHVVVLGAANLSCTRLKDDIYEIIFKLVEDNPRDSQKIDSLNIVYGDESLPRLYENSHISIDQLPSQEGIIRRAVALGRYLQNPLAMAATLCGPGREILSWKLNPLEKFLTPDEKYGMVEQVMIDATNQVGLDINLASSHEWLFSPLQFISGLGPRKAASLQRSLGRAGAIFTRKDLLTSHGLGKKVFINAVGFLRVRRSGLSSSSSQFIDLLDNTRIHPESYSLAQDFAKDVYCESMNNEVNDDDDDDLLELAIEHVRENPHLLTAVDVHEYAEQKKRQNKKETLNDIRLELMDGFQDRRKSHAEPNQDDEFYMIAGEAEETLAEGRIVQATVRRVQEDRAICNLDSGLTGILSKEDYTDDWRDINELTDKLHEGDILTCRIKSIQKNRYQVFLTCRESEMRSYRFQNNQIVDPYFHEERSTLQPKQEIAHKEEFSKKLFKPRMIVHPQFKNITADEAFEFLRDKEAGESVIRPSLRGPSYLTLTLKVCDGVFANKDIVEGQKELKDITSLLQIGKKLKIGEDTFEDLDEVMDRYVDPLIAHLKTMLNYRKFRKGTKTDIDELLRIEKAKIPTKIVYCLGLSYDHPGTFILTYIRSANPHHEYIGLYPKGFKFRKRMFGDVDRLVAYFQKHIDDPHSSGPTIQSAAAMVPIRSFGSGDDWGGSNNDGDRGGSQSMDGDKTFGMGSRGGRGDSQNGGRGRGRGGGRGRGRGRGCGRGRDSYGDDRSDKLDFDHDSQKWGSNNDKGVDWGGGASGSAGGWGGGDGSGNTGSWSGVGGGSKGDGNRGGGGSGSAGGWGGGGSGNTGGWGVAGGGIKSDSNWGGGGSGGAGGLGGGGDRTESAGGWGGGGRGDDRSGSVGGQGGGDDNGNSGGWGGAGGGSKKDGNWGGGGSGGAGGWGGGGGDQSGSAGGGNKSDGNWGGDRRGDAGGWGGVGGGGRGGAGGWGGAGGGSKKDGNWGGGGSGGAGGWGGGGGDQSGSAGGGNKSDGNWGGGRRGDAGGWGGVGGGGRGGAGGWGGGRGGSQMGSAGNCEIGGDGNKTDGNWGGCRSGDTKGWGEGESGTTRVGDGGGGQSGSTGGWGGGSTGHGGSGKTGGWGGGGRDNADGSGRGASGGSGGEGGGSGRAGTRGGGGNDGDGGGSANAGSWGGSGGGSGSAGAWGDAGGTSADGGSVRPGGWGGGSNNRSTGGTGEGIGSGSTGGWGGVGSHKSAGGGDRGSGWGSGGDGGSTDGWKGGGHDNVSGDWGGSHGALGDTKGGGAGWGGGRGSSAGGRYGRSGGTGGGRGGSSSRSTGGRGGGTGSGRTGGWGGGRGSTGGWKGVGKENTGTGWGGSHGASGDNKGGGAGWGGGHGSSGGSGDGDGGGGGQSGGAGAWGGSERANDGGWVGSGSGGTGAWGVGGSSNAGGGNANTGGWVGSGSGGTGAWGVGSSSNDGGGNASTGGWGGGSSTGGRGGGTGSGSTGGWGSGGVSETTAGGGWGVSGAKKEGGGGWGQGSDSAGNSGWGSSKKSSEAGKGGW